MFESDPEPPKIQPTDIVVYGGRLLAKLFAAAHLDPLTALGASQIIDSVFHTPYEKRRLEAMEDQILVLQRSGQTSP